MNSGTAVNPHVDPGDVIPVPFNGGEVLTVDVDGKPHIVLRPAIEALGLDYSTQLRKLRRRSWACVGQRPTQMPGDDQRREVTTVDVRTFLMLLATIDESRVADDARSTLIAHQSEVADAVEKYWTEGGAINPSASADQLGRLIAAVEGQMRVLQLAAGLVDAHWLEAKTRHVVARALGEEPEVAFDTRPLTVGEYLEGKGVTGAALRSLSTGFGKRLKAAYVEARGQNPPKVDRFVDGALRSVAGYTEADRPLFDQVFATLAVAR